MTARYPVALLLTLGLAAPSFAALDIFPAAGPYVEDFEGFDPGTLDEPVNTDGIVVSVDPADTAVIATTISPLFTGFGSGSQLLAEFETSSNPTEPITISFGDFEVIGAGYGFVNVEFAFEADGFGPGDSIDFSFGGAAPTTATTFVPVDDDFAAGTIGLSFAEADLPGLGDGTFTFDITLTDATPDTDLRFAIDDVTFGTSLDPFVNIPEPTAFLFGSLIAGSVGMVASRRKRQG